MKIIFDHQIFSLQIYGGISRYMCELAQCLAATSKQDVSIVAPLYVNNYLQQSPVSLKVYGLATPPIPKTGRFRSAINWAVAWLCIRILQPDIVHETYYSEKRIAPVNAKVILTVYDMIHERFADQFPHCDATAKLKAMAVARADHIICISEHTRQDLIAMLGVHPDKISVVHLGFGLMNVSKQPQEIENILRPFLLYVGLREGYKNFEGLLRAYADSATLKNGYDLVCFGGGAFTQKELDIIDLLDLTQSAVRHVSGSDDKLASYYKTAHAFVFPSLYEGFGIPPLEAMNHSCPVVCSNVSSIPEVVGDAGLFFNPNNTQSIKLAIERVVSDAPLRALLVACGQERIKHFSWEKCAEDTLAVYHKALI
jgi:glycosyltransferase involved in cell wall biosynthesis